MMENTKDEVEPIKQLQINKPYSVDGQSSAPAPQSKTTPVTLRKELSLISGVGLIFGNVIGSGIFITTSGILGRTHSFGLTLLTWLAGGIIAMIGALCYCELGTMIKKSGSEYAYILEAYSFGGKNQYTKMFGSMLGFVNVWYDSLVGNPASLSIALLVFGRYMCRPFFIGCPQLPVLPVKMFALAALSDWGNSHLVQVIIWNYHFVCIPLISVASMMVNIYSVKWASRLASWLSFLKFLSLGFVVILGIWHIIAKGCFSKEASDPFAGSTNSAASIALALYGVMYAYDGWDALNMVQEETTNIDKVLPRAILIALPLVILSYCLVNVAFFAVLSYEEIESAEAVGLVFGNAVLGKVGLVIFPLLVALASFSSAHVSLFTESRKLYVSSRDGNMPDFFGGVHYKYRTPVPAVLFITVLSAVFICIGTIDQLVDAFVATVWFFYGLAIGGIFIMRLTQPERHRPFKVWLILPSLMIVVTIFLVVMPLLQQALPQIIAFGGTLLGFPVYFIIVMEKPWKLRPKILDKISDKVTIFVNNLLNTESTR